MFKKNLIGIGIMILGILAGLLLIQQSQEYREKAKEEVEEKVVICHKQESDGVWVEMELEQSRLEEYIQRGDVLGKCPEEK